MAKKRFTMNNFSGGINNLKDARDIAISEFAFLQGFIVDRDGALRPMITGPNNAYQTEGAHNGLFSNTTINNVACSIQKSGGNNLAYMESDIDLFFQGGTYGGSYATTDEDIDFIATNESNVGEGETTIPRRKGTI